MALKIYNALSRQTEEFEPLNPPQVGLYTCGPTVYNYLHIGNWRSYIFADLLKRYLVYSGYQVKHIMNITDVEDKIIKAILDQKKDLGTLTEEYTNDFYQKRDLLNILPADVYPKATEYIKQIVDLIEILLEKGYAYKAEDNSIYFDIKKDKDYGKLSRFKIEDLKKNAQGRLKKDEYDKENAQDFALWKAWTPEDGNVFWETGLGKGRPGWHIECSAMSMDQLGQSFDIHTGGIDNMFPHHENEIAQSECATEKPFAKYFLYNEHLMVNGQKMAKSAGNFYTLQDLVDKGIDPIAFRLWLLGSHYTTKTNFTLETIGGAGKTFDKLKDFYLNLDNKIGEVDENYKKQFIIFLDDNLNTPKALALVWKLIKDDKISEENKRSTLLDFDKVLGLGLKKLKKGKIPKEIIKIAEERKLARENKDWPRGDQLREKINSLGYEIKDIDSSFEILKIK